MAKTFFHDAATDTVVEINADLIVRASEIAHDNDTTVRLYEDDRIVLDESTESGKGGFVVVDSSGVVGAVELTDSFPFLVIANDTKQGIYWGADAAAAMTAYVLDSNPSEASAADALGIPVENLYDDVRAKPAVGQLDWLAA